MNPIWRFRILARSENVRFCTVLPSSQYSPAVGESRRPRIESRVDFPHPDGPSIERYSPRRTSRWIPDSACVSTSSVVNTFCTSLRRSNGAPFPVRRDGAEALAGSWVVTLMRTSPSGFFRSDRLSEMHLVRVVPPRHVGQDQTIAFLQPLEHLDRVGRAATELDRHPPRVASVGVELEQPHRGLARSVGRTPDVERVRDAVDLNGRVHAQIGPRAARERVV